MVSKFSSSSFSKAILLFLAVLGSIQLCYGLEDIATDSITVEEPSKIVNIVLLGSTGNLAEKYLWQSLFNIHRDGVKNGQKIFIYPSASSSKEKSMPVLNKILDNNMTVESGDAVEKQRLKSFRKKHIFEYHQLRELADYIVINKKIQNHLNRCNCIEAGRIFYLSVPPRFFATVARNIKESGLLTSKTKVVIEKPFGTDHSSAQDLSSLLFRYLSEDQIRLVDHYMGKQALESLRTFRINNPFEHKIVNLEAVMFEKETCAGRTWFYDDVGVIKDTMQNHLMMMLTLFIAHLTPQEHVDRLIALKSLNTPEESGVKFIGQYDGYKQHLLDDDFGYKTAMKSKTATYAEIEFKVIRVDTQMLPGAGINFKAGKGLDRRTAYVRATFEDGSFVMLNIQGKNEIMDGTGLFIRSKEGWQVNLPESWIHIYEENDDGLIEQTIRFNEPGVRVPGAYEVLLRAAIEGSDQYFVSLSEVLQSWKILRDIIPISSATAPESYNVGSNPDSLKTTTSKEEL